MHRALKEKPNMPLIITAGSKYVDIDVLACCVAYKQLCDVSEKESAIHLTGPFNATITSEIELWSQGFINKKPPLEDLNLQYVIMDVSHPDYFESFVKLDQVTVLYDHHFGHEEFWQARLGNRSQIEAVGACATLIWEAYKMQGYADLIPIISAQLLYAAIVANTLNFKSNVTTIRDIRAAQELHPRTNFSKDWVTGYYNEVERSILSNFPAAVRHDTKTIAHKGEQLFLAQIELWNEEVLFKSYSPETISQIIESIYPNSAWILSLVCIEKGFNYLFSSTNTVKTDLTKFMELTSVLAEESFSCWKSDRLWLRKEILKHLKL